MNALTHRIFACLCHLTIRTIIAPCSYFLFTLTTLMVTDDCIVATPRWSCFITLKFTCVRSINNNISTPATFSCFWRTCILIKLMCNTIDAYFTIADVLQYTMLTIHLRNINDWLPIYFGRCTRSVSGWTFGNDVQALSHPLVDYAGFRSIRRSFTYLGIYAGARFSEHNINVTTGHL